MSANDLYGQNFELVIILEGVIESTGMTTQARTSYLPAEILWGHRFERLVAFQKENGQYIIDYLRFNSTIKVDTPWCSAKAMEEGNDSVESDDNDNDDDDDYSGTESSNETETTAMDRNGNILSSPQKSDQLLNVSDLGRSLSRISDVSTIPTVCQSNSFLIGRNSDDFVTSSPIIAIPPRHHGSTDHADVKVVFARSPIN